MSGERRHPAEGVSENALQHDRMGGIARRNELVGWIIAVISGNAIDELCLVEREPGSIISGLRARTARLMTLNAILREVVPRAKCQTRCMIGSRRKNRIRR